MTVRTRVANPHNLKVLRTRAVAELFGVSDWTIRNWRRKGILPKPIKMSPGSPDMYRERDIEAVLLKRQHGRRPKTKSRGAVKEANP